MKRKFIKRFLPVVIICVLIAGCSTNTNQEADTVTNISTEENASSADNTKKNVKGEKERNNSESQGRQGAQGNIAERRDDGGRMGQKTVLTDDQKKLIEATKDKFQQKTYEDVVIPFAYIERT